MYSLSPPKSKSKAGPILGIICIVLIVIIIIIDVIMFATKKVLFAPYTPPIPDQNTSVSPNGHPGLKGSIQVLPQSMLTTVNSNLTTYKSTNPQSIPSEWGAFT